MTIPPNKYLFIEIKCGIEIIPYLKNVLHHYQVKTEQIKIIGFSFKKMTLIKNSFPEFEVLLNKRISIGKIFLGKSYWENLITNLKLNYLDGLNISYTKSLNFKLIETFKNNKLKLFVWTINKPEKALRLINFGIDGIMSDRAGWIREKINL
ncbi:MAG: hypothetical protein IPJ23_14495 [Ignavibacteriales bacterium]|nr:hypothetical protein [Ignavibacteriales bacterium]